MKSVDFPGKTEEGLPAISKEGKKAVHTMENKYRRTFLKRKMSSLFAPKEVPDAQVLRAFLFLFLTVFVAIIVWTGREQGQPTLCKEVAVLIHIFKCC